MKSNWKPNWEDAPTWANYLVMYYNGSWAWFDQKPYPCGDIWCVPDPYSVRMEMVGFPDWEESIEERPRNDL